MDWVWAGKRLQLLYLIDTHDYICNDCRHVSEPAVRVSGLPVTSTEVTVSNLFKNLNASRIEILPELDGKGKKQARVVFIGDRDLETAMRVFENKPINDEGQMEDLNLSLFKERNVLDDAVNSLNNIDTSSAIIEDPKLLKEGGTTNPNESQIVSSRRRSPGGRRKKTNEWREGLQVTQENVYDIGMVTEIHTVHSI